MLPRVGFTVRLSTAFKNPTFENYSKRRIWSMAGKGLRMDNLLQRWQQVSKPPYTFKNTDTSFKNFYSMFLRTIFLVSSRPSTFMVNRNENTQIKTAYCPGSSITVRTMAKKASKGKGKVKRLTIDAEMAEGIVDITTSKAKMENVIENMSNEFSTKIPDRITIGFIDNVLVKTAAGKKIPLYQIALVKAKSDNFTIEIQENFSNAGKAIASAIAETGFNLIPQVRGDTVIVPIPIFSQDQRANFGKMAKTISDQAKTELRKLRQKAMSDIRKNKEGESKDLIRRIENMVQQLIDFYTERIDSGLEAKTNEILGGKFK